MPGSKATPNVPFFTISLPVRRRSLRRGRHTGTEEKRVFVLDHLKRRDSADCTPQAPPGRAIEFIGPGQHTSAGRDVHTIRANREEDSTRKRTVLIEIR